MIYNINFIHYAAPDLHYVSLKEDNPGITNMLLKYKMI